MNYDHFRSVFVEGLQQHFSQSFFVEERIDPRDMDRYFSVRIHGGDIGPLHVSAKMHWRWDALTSARTQTDEEHAIRAFLGMDRKLESMQPWMRINMELAAFMPYETVAPMPQVHEWEPWALALQDRLLVCLKHGANEKGDVEGAIGHPEIRAGSPANHGFGLTAVVLDIWEAILLPRRWSDERLADPDPELDEMIGRFARAKTIWERQLTELFVPPDSMLN